MYVPVLGLINEWNVPNFQADKFHLLFIVGLFAVMFFYGVRLQGPRLLTLLLVTVFALEHKRGLGLFALVAPLLILRPLSESLRWIGGLDTVADPVAGFVARRSRVIGFGCAIAVAFTALIMWVAGPRVRPPNWVAPEQALDAARHANLTGNILNSYTFGGYLIFEGIPTFVDGRVGLFGNQFLERYLASMTLADANEAARLLKQYDVSWALLRPSEPIVFMLKVDGWKQLYKDQDAIVLTKD